MKTKKQKEVLRILQDRTNQYLSTFCTVGNFTDAEGKAIGGVCKAMDASDFVNFMNVTVAMVVDALEERALPDEHDRM